MPKFNIGDVAFLNEHRSKAMVIVRIVGWRGGGVAPYTCEITQSDYYFYKVGATHYFAGRDMELLEMQGKKKIYCCVPKCTTYSFESSGTIQWQCDKHCPVPIEPIYSPSLSEKVDLILEHLGLEVFTEPSKTVLKKVEKAE